MNSEPQYDDSTYSSPVNNRGRSQFPDYEQGSYGTNSQLQTPRSTMTEETKKKKAEELEDLIVEMDKLNMEDIKRIFDEADLDGGGDLDEEEFVKLFGKLLKDAPEEPLRAMFRKIDSNANGTVTFDEFSTYILFQEADKMAVVDSDNKLYKQQYITDHNKRKVRHNDSIVSIEMDLERNVYFTASRDGTVRAWDADDLTHINTFHFAPTKACITDIAFERTESEIYVAGLDRMISVYNSKHNLVRVYKGKPFHYAYSKPERFIYSIPTHLKAEFNQPIDPENQADVKRYIENVKSQRCSSDAYLIKTQNSIYTPIILTDFVDAPSAIAHWHRDQSLNLIVGFDDGALKLYDITNFPGEQKILCNVEKKWKPHGGWVTKILPVEALNGTISCSLDGTIAITHLDANPLTVRILTGHEKSVYSIDYSVRHKLVASGGRDRDIFIWNPFLEKRLARLKEHSAPVLRVAFNEKDSQLITVGTDKVIKIWDIRTYRTIQTLQEDNPLVSRHAPQQMHKHKRDNFTAAYYDRKNCNIVTAVNNLKVWPMQKETTDFKLEYQGHRAPVIKVLYNVFLKHIISCEEGVIAAWDIETGQLMYKFTVPHTIVDCIFDGQQRRIVTICDEGQIIVWNYINGTQVKACQGIKNEELNTLVYVYRETQDLRVIAAGGTNKTVFLWNDSDEEFELSVSRTMAKLPSDIRKLCFVYPSTMIAGLDDGSIFSLDFITGDIRMKVRCRKELRYTDYDDMFSEDPTAATRMPMNREANAKVYFEDMKPFKEQMMVTSRGNGLVTFWDVSGLRELYTFQGATNGESVTALCTNDTFSMLITGDNLGNVTLFDTSRVSGYPNTVTRDSFRIIRRLTIHTKCISDIAYIPGYNLWATSSFDCTILLLDIHGNYIGFFGQSQLWKISDPATYSLQQLEDLKSMNHSESESEEEEEESESSKATSNTSTRTQSPADFTKFPDIQKSSSENPVKRAVSYLIGDQQGGSPIGKIGKSIQKNKFPPIKRAVFSKETRLNKVQEIEESLLNNIGGLLSNVGMDIDHLTGKINSDIYKKKDNQVADAILTKIRKDISDKNNSQYKKQQHYYRNVLQRKINEKDWVQNIHHLIEISDEDGLHKFFDNKDSFDVERVIQHESQQQRSMQLNEKRKKQMEQSEKENRKKRGNKGIL